MLCDMLCLSVYPGSSQVEWSKGDSRVGWVKEWGTEELAEGRL